MDGVRVVRVWTYVAPNRGTVRRSLDYLSFMTSAVPASLLERRPSVVVGTSPQPLAALAASWVAAIRRVPFVLEVRDLWPESLVAVGAGGGPMVRALERVAERALPAGRPDRLRHRVLPEDPDRARCPAGEDRRRSQRRGSERLPPDRRPRGDAVAPRHPRERVRPGLRRDDGHGPRARDRARRGGSHARRADPLPPRGGRGEGGRTQGGRGAARTLRTSRSSPGSRGRASPPSSRRPTPSSSTSGTRRSSARSSRPRSSRPWQCRGPSSTP